MWCIAERLTAWIRPDYNVEADHPADRDERLDRDPPVLSTFESGHL
jgi:hypothetical protein